MHRNDSRFWRGVLTLALFLAIGPTAGAFQQVGNGSFTLDAANWSADTIVAGDFNTMTGGWESATGSATLGSYKVGGRRKAQGNATVSDYAYARIYQYFPTGGGVLASPAYIDCAVSYRGAVTFDTGASPANWEVYLTAGVYDNVGTTLVNAQHFLDFSKSGTTVWSTAPWTRVATLTYYLPEGASYSVALKWKLGCGRPASSYAYVYGWMDYCYANMSPIGLVATETATQAAFLTWASSTYVTGAPGPAVATYCYRVYRSTSPGGPFTYASATYRPFWYEVPTEDEVYYKICDVDRSGAVSPLSVPATFKRARLVITKVEAGQTNVTRGQTGVPVKVFLSNPGYSPARFDGASLTFKIPEVGSYTWIRTSPAVGTVIPAEGTLEVDFSVNILEASICDIDTIDATASATSLTTGVSLGDTGADLTANWLIRAPAFLRVLSIAAPNSVYLGQTDVAVDVTVENMGDKNAAGLLDSITLTFDKGSYLNIRPQNPLPVTIYAGQATTVRYLLEVDPTSATGTANIDATIAYRDANLLMPSTNMDGALIPDSWIIVAGIVNTYKDPAFIIKLAEFNQGYYTVFAKAENLAPLKEHRMRWYRPAPPDSDGGMASFSDPAVLTNADGNFTSQFELTPSSPRGWWRVVGTRVFDTIPLCENTFFVGAPANATLTFALPPTVSLNSTFVATLTFGNLGDATILDGELATLTWLPTNTGTASWLTGPSPVRQNIPGPGQATFTYTFRANSTGNFQLKVNGFGYDENATSTPFVQAATVTSNLCVIQTPPVLTVTGVTDAYVAVSPGQEGLAVDMTVTNSGEATAILTAATLTHSLAAVHSEYVASPTAWPVALAGGKTTTIRFIVAVDEAATGGTTNTISGNIRGYDANNPVAIVGDNGGSCGWNILTVKGLLSPSSSYSPEGYSYSTGQRVYVRFDHGANSNTKEAILVFGPDGQIATSPSQDSGQYRTYDFSTTAQTLGAWRVELWTMTGGGAPSTLVGRLYFNLFNPTALTGVFTLSPSTVEVGATVTATLTVTQGAGGGTVSSFTPNLPTKTAGSVGNLSLASGPTPTVATITPDFPAVFTWQYTAVNESGAAPASYSMIASGSGIDTTTTQEVSVTDLSNSITIVRRKLALSLPAIDFGTMQCNDRKATEPFTVDNTGNVALTNVKWQASHLLGPGEAYIDRANISFSPTTSTGFSIPLSSSQSASATLEIPYNTPTGTYQVTMNIWDDYFPTNGARDVTEPFDDFLVTVVVAPTELVVLNQDSVNMGNCPQDNPVATKTFSGFNGGNVEIASLSFVATETTFTQPAHITFTPPAWGPLATDDVFLASVTAFIDAAETNGTKIATVTVFNDKNANGKVDSGEPFDQLQLIFQVGTIGLTVTPDPLNLGPGTPTYTISNVPFQIQNTGTLPLSSLKLFPGDLVGPGGAIIPGENLIPELPSTINAAATGNATMSLYVAAGVPAGLYTGTQILFEDLDGDGTYIGDSAEASTTFLASVTVNAYSAVQVIDDVINLGGRTPNEVATVSFLCRNIGSVPLNKLNWFNVDLFSGGNSIPATAYGFTPGGLFPIPVGLVFSASITMTIPSSTPDGDYYGQYGYLFDDATATDNLVGPQETQDKFGLACKIGAKSINIVDAYSRLVGGTPFATLPGPNYTINNNGSLLLARPIATMTTDLVNGTSQVIPRSAITFSPAVFDFMNAGQSKTGTWQVAIPANAVVGSYVGTLKVWNDEDNGGDIDTFEASDTCQLEVEVISKAVLNVVQNPLDMGFIPAGRSATATIEVVNVGNVDMTGANLLAVVSPVAPVSPGPPAVPAPTITLPAALSSFAPGASFLATVSVTIPLTQTSLPYQSDQEIRADVNGDGIFDASDTFLLKFTVGEKRILADTPLLFGTCAPDGTYPYSFTIFNLTSISISNGRFSFLPLIHTDGINSIGSTCLSVSPTPFTIGPGSSKSCTFSLALAATQTPGTYIGTHTAFEDDNWNGVCDGFEASAPLQVQVTVATRPVLVIDETSLDAGSAAPGEETSTVTLTYRNTGNATFTDLHWFATPLVNGGNTIPAGLVTFTPANPVSPLAPGSFLTATVKVGPIPAGTAGGVYTGTLGIYDATELGAGYLLASDVFTLTLTVVSSVAGPEDVASGSVYQEIATSTFLEAAPWNRFILSAWVCPGTGSARITFFDVDSDMKEVSSQSVQVSAGGAISLNGGIEGGIVDSFVASQANTMVTWYRVFLSINYEFDPNNASRTYVLLENTSPVTASHSVWFEGFQLEKASFPGQTRPTTFSRNRKVISPNSGIDIGGQRRYFEW